MKKLSLFLTILVFISCFTACGEPKENNSLDLKDYVSPVEYVAKDDIVSSGKHNNFYYIEHNDYIEITDCSLPQGSKNIEFPSQILNKPVKVITAPSLRGNEYLISAIIPDTVTEIGNYLFNDCYNLVNITLPNTIKKVGCSAFLGTPWFEKLTDEFVIIGDGVLIKYNGKGGDITLPQTVKFLSDAFADNSKILRVDIPLSVVGLSDYAFYNCASLSEIFVPSHISDIGAHAFYGTTWLMAENDDFVILGNQVLIDYLGSETNVTIPDTIKYISSAFDSKTSVTSVIIPASVNCVLSGAFYECSSLTSVTFLGPNTQIEENAFTGCTNLTEITLPENLKIISDFMFYSCLNLKKIDLPKNISYIGTSAFYGCESLIEITIPDTLKTVNSAAFFGCIKLEHLNLPDSVSSMGEVALACCYELKEFTIPKSLTTIHTGLFSYCIKLKELHIPEQIKNIGEGAFEGCNGISVYINGDSTTLGKDVFLSCDEGTHKIYCTKGSKAEEYAKKNKIKYSIIKI